MKHLKIDIIDVCETVIDTPRDLDREGSINCEYAILTGFNKRTVDKMVKTMESFRTIDEAGEAFPDVYFTGYGTAKSELFDYLEDVPEEVIKITFHRVWLNDEVPWTGNDRTKLIKRLMAERDEARKRPYLKIDELEIGEAYELDARNLSKGIWDGEHFNGMRTCSKTGDIFLFPEGHWDAGDTAKPLRKLS